MIELAVSWVWILFTDQALRAKVAIIQAKFFRCSCLGDVVPNGPVQAHAIGALA